jgi:hypothetical protein
MCSTNDSPVSSDVPPASAAWQSAQRRIADSIAGSGCVSRVVPMRNFVNSRSNSGRSVGRPAVEPGVV